MERVKKYIFQQVAQKRISSEEATGLFLELQNATRVETDIAIIGMACRFPGANNPDDFWQNIQNSVHSITHFPLSRRQDTDYLFADFLGKIDEKIVAESYAQGGFLDEVDKFDPAFFRISPREAKLLDPLHRILLEVYWEAMEEAGYGGDKLVGSQTGVFVGKDHMYYSRYRETLDENDTLVATGSWPGILAGRVSYVFDFHGPCMVIDTACSSGLVAVHEACQAIKSQECDLALAGGIHLIGIPGKGGYLTLVESQDYVVRSFDKKANGTVWGEGVGAVLLKPLKKALEDGDHIHAVIKGSAINNDGTTNGITAPSAEAQEQVLLKAWEEARLDPSTISYVEAHATGTVLGDPVEAKGLTNAFRRHTDKKQFCGIGSVKPNVGHLVGAAGVASFFKVVLALKNRKLPPTLNMDEPNEYINFLDSPLYINDRLREWPGENGPRRAGVSAFGFSGTNCHVVLEEAPEPLNRVKTETAQTLQGVDACDTLAKEEENVKVLPTAGASELPHLLTVSARNREVLMKMLQRYARFIKYKVDLASDDLCFTANTGRGHYAVRAVILFKNIEDLQGKLEKLVQENLERVTENWFFFGEHRLLVSDRTLKGEGEITEEERRRLTRLANIQLNALLDFMIGHETVPGSERNDPDMQIKEICRLYVLGADIQWDDLYRGQAHTRLSLPVYPLERLRFWPEEKVAVERTRQTEKEIAHPFLDRLLADTMYQDTFLTSFSPKRHWVLGDHQVMGRYVMPGTGYLEMAREASRKHYPAGQIHLQDVVFLKPLIVDEGEIKKVQTILGKVNDSLELTIASQDAEGIWVKHTIGKISELTSPPEREWNLEELKGNFPGFDNLECISGEPSSENFKFGSRWYLKTKVSVNADRTELLAELELSEKVQADMREFTLHPSLLDQAVNMAIRNIGEGLYLPMSYKSFKLYAPMTSRVYCYIRTKEKLVRNSEIASFNITLMDSTGKLIAEIWDYGIKKVREAALKFDSEVKVHHQISWVEQQIPAPFSAPNALAVASSGAKMDVVFAETEQVTGSEVLLFADEKGLAQELAKRLRVDGYGVIEVKLADRYAELAEDRFTISGEEKDYDTLLTTLRKRNITHIIHMHTLTELDDILHPAQLSEAQNRGVYSLFYLTRALLRQKYHQELQLILITDYAYAVTGAEPCVKPHQASLLGMGKVVGDEYANLHCRAIDVDDSISAEAIIAELRVKTINYLTAYRQGKWYIQELNTLRLENTTGHELNLASDGVYIITGGTGGLGLEMARYLAEKGQVNLALLNRSSLPGRETWEQICAEGANEKLTQKLHTLMEIEQMGAQVSCHAVEISNYEELAKVITNLRERYGRIRGIIHSAGLAGDGLIIRKEENVFRSVLAPKVQGTWNLDRLTKEDRLDFFILFSSIMSILGGPGQSDYAAANAYLDAFAAYKKLQGVKALTINWTAWKETGMAVDYGVNDDRGVFKSITTGQAIDAFDQAVQADISNVIIGELNYTHEVFRHLDYFPIQLAANLRAIIEKRNRRSGDGARENSRRTRTEVVLKGRSDGNYTELERQLATIWSEILEINELNIYDDLYELGGDSILAIKISNLIKEELKKEIEVSDLFQYLTIQALAEHISGIAGEVGKSEVVIALVEEREYYPLSSAQKRIYILNHFENVGTAYNISMAIKIDGGFNHERMADGFQQLTRRHEILRTSFEMVDGELVQRIHPDAVAQVDRLEYSEDWKETVRQYVRPFDLTKAPLMRIGTLELPNGDGILVLDIHHIIGDGSSLIILFHELLKLIMGGELAPLTVQYKDYSVWQNEHLQSSKMREQEEFWLKIYSGEVPVLNLPTDYPRPNELSFEGDSVNFDLEPAVCEGLHKLMVTDKVTLFNTLLAIYYVLLAKYSGQDDIVVGSPVSGRNHAVLENMIGLFINTLPFRNYPASEKTFKQFLAEVRDNMLSAYANQEYQYEHLIEKLDLPRDQARNPLFDVMFVLYNFEADNRRLNLNEFVNKTSQFDLTLTVIEKDDYINCSLDYRTRLFTAETAQRMAQHFINIVTDAVSNPDKTLAELEMLSKEEKEQVVQFFNQTDVTYRTGITVQQMFEEQVQKTPDALALVAGEGSLTYSELNAKANQLARVLRECGVQREEIVALKVERSLAMITGLLAVLKAGGAYLPIDPAYPRARVEFLLSDSGARVLLTATSQVSGTGSSAEELSFNGLILDLLNPEVYQGDTANLDIVNEETDLMYVIYTSGTTGQPKGVMVEHRSVTNLLQWYVDEFELMTPRNLLLSTNYTFDPSIEQIFGALISGSTLHLAEQAVFLEKESFLRFVQERQLYMVNFVPAVLKELLADTGKLPGLHAILSGGDRLDKALQNQLVAQGYRLSNHYGPTETTVDALVARCTAGEVSIGKPIANVRCYILDQQLNPVPVGVPGEIFLAGSGLARGYLHNLELTTARFIADPFHPGARMYRTGDYAKWLPEGKVAFIGRMDAQVKIRGFRIELGEIEAHIAALPGIKEVVVIAGTSDAGEEYLAAYVSVEQEFEDTDWRAELAKSLPAHLVPAYVVRMEALPRTASAKIDRKALPLPDESLRVRQRYVAPENAIEETLVQLWSEALGIEKVGVYDNFFEIGGHSLKAIALMAKIQKEFTVQLPMREIFNNPTVKEIAQYIATAKNLSLDLTSDERYWSERLATPLSVLNLPFDFTETAVDDERRLTFGSAVGVEQICFEESGEDMAALRRMTADHRITLLAALLGAYSILLNKCTGSNDVIINAVNLGQATGVNKTWPVRSYLMGNKSIVNFLEEIQFNLEEDRAHYGCDMQALVEKLQIGQGRSHEPLFDVAFAYNEQLVLNERAMEGAHELTAQQDLRAEQGVIAENAPEEARQINANLYKLTLMVEEDGDKLNLSLAYRPDLFKKATIEDLAARFLTILQQIANEPTKSLGDIRSISEQENQAFMQDLFDDLEGEF